MPVNVLTGPIEQGVPLIVLAPHLDDAALSCGALMLHAARHTSVTVATLFTEADQAPYTLSARRYLRQVGARSAPALYQQRRDEDREARARARLPALFFLGVAGGGVAALFPPVVLIRHGGHWPRACCPSSRTP